MIFVDIQGPFVPVPEVYLCYSGRFLPPHFPHPPVQLSLANYGSHLTQC